MKCSKCQTDNPDGVKFCGECGKPLSTELTCPQCGHKSPPGTKFCHNCGHSFASPDTLNLNSTQSSPLKNDSSTKIVANGSEIVANVGESIANTKEILSENFAQQGNNAYQLGRKLEDAVEKILTAQGYTTSKRQRLSGEKGKSEIDIIAVRTTKGGFRDELFVECKNYSSPVPVIAIRDFDSKMTDLGKKNGLFAAIPDFSRDAEEWAQGRGFKLWNWDTIKEKIAEVEVGRLGTAERTTKRNILPLKVSYSKITTLEVQNKEHIEISECKLIWKPIYKIGYKLNCVRTNPRKEKIVVKDSDYYLIDGLSGDILEKSKLVKSLFKKVIGQSNEETLKTKETDIFIKELEQEPDSGVIEESESYKTVIINPQVQSEQAKRIMLERAVDDYTEDHPYTLKSDEDALLPDQRSFVVTPKFSEFDINDFKLIYVPKWEVEFQSKEYKYTKIVTANSGKVIYDTFTHCVKHWKIGIGGLGKKHNVAVCDVCGELLCKEHIWQCPKCESWRCGAHSKTCASCQKQYCPEHLTAKCADCDSFVCEQCAVSCPICGQPHCKAHMSKCSKCQHVVCVSCTRKEGGILSFGQKTICKKC